METSAPETKKSKGKTVGIWVSGAVQEALEDMKKANPHFREGSYATEALIQRLEKEGRLQKTSTESAIAAEAYELSKVFGSDRVRAKLVELLLDNSAPLPAARASA